MNFFFKKKSGVLALSSLPFARFCSSSQVFDQKRDCLQSKRQFSIAYCKTSTNVTLANHKGDSQAFGPIKTRSKINTSAHDKWDFQNNATRTSPPRPTFVLQVPLRNLFTSMCDFASCDQIVQRAYFKLLKPVYFNFSKNFLNMTKSEDF